MPAGLFTRFRELPAPERRLCALALVLLPAMRMSVYFWGFAATHRACRCWATNPVVEDSEPGLNERARVVATTGQLIGAAARHGRSGARCLPRSLVVWTLLRRQGVDAQIRFGARRRDRRIETHAWVEAAGLTIDDGAAGEVTQRFAPFAPLA